MKFLKIATVLSSSAIGIALGEGSNLARASGLSGGAPAVRTLAAPVSEVSVEKAYYYRRWRYRHRLCRSHWRPHWHHYYRRHYWHHYYSFWYPYRYYRPYWWAPYYE